MMNQLPLTALLTASQHMVMAVSDPDGRFSLPWRIPEDLQWFAKTTANCDLILGYQTYRDMVNAGVGHGNRRYFVLCRRAQKQITENTAMPIIGTGTVENLQKYAGERSSTRSWIVIGGPTTLRLLHPFINSWVLTMVHDPNARKRKGSLCADDFRGREGIRLAGYIGCGVTECGRLWRREIWIR